MTPTEAEDIMKPFFPNDPNLAVKALNRALNEGPIPEWIANSIVGAYFTFLAVNQLNNFLGQYDPFGLNTVPYLGYHKENNN